MLLKNCRCTNMYFTAGCRLRSAFVILDLLFRAYKNTSLKRRENPRAEELICGVWVANATWHSWSALIFWYYDKQLIMQVAWIISVHLVAFGRSETSPAADVRLAGGSKNTISQVVSHELKIARHSFPVRLPQPPPSHPHPNVPPAHRVPWQKATFLPTGWRNLRERKRRREEEGKEKSDVNTWPTYPVGGPAHLPPRYDSHPRMFSQCFTLFFLFFFFFYLVVNFGDVWIRWQMGRKCERDTSVGLR